MINELTSLCSLHSPPQQTAMLPVSVSNLTYGADDSHQTKHSYYRPVIGRHSTLPNVLHAAVTGGSRGMHLLARETLARETLSRETLARETLSRDMLVKETLSREKLAR